MDPQKKVWGVSVKTFLMLWGAGVVGAAAVLPYAFALQSEVIANAPVSIPVLALASVLQSAVLLGIATFFGLKLAQSTGYGIVPTKPFVKRSILLGVVAGIAILLAEILFVSFTSFQGYLGVSAPSWWQGLLASLYGGVAEELLLRLFLMTLIAWVIARATKQSALASVVAWSAIIIAAVLFGVGHLPAAAQLGPLTAIVIMRTMTLNAIGGLIFGWLYWRYGLVAAMLAHFSTDIVLHVIFPLI